MTYVPPTDLLTLLSLPGVSGYEEPVTAFLAEQLEGVVRVRSDAIGNLTGTVGSDGPSILMIVHTDEVGFVVSGIRDDGAVYLTPIGAWDLDALGGRQLDIHRRDGTSVPGVTITVPPHLDRNLSGTGAWREGGQVVADIGADDRDGVRALGVDVLDPVTLARDHAVLANGRIVARGLDNRFGCYLLLRLARSLAKSPPQNARISLAWASQEEVGFRGPKALARRETFDAVIAIDAFPADRRPGAALATDAVRLGHGPVVRGADLTGVGSTRFRDGILGLAAARGVAVQPAYAQGHNQASVFHTAAAIAIDLPVAYLHSTVESIDPDDLHGAAVLLEAVARHDAPEQLWTR